MSRIALYNILRKIPGVSDNEAEEAVDAITRSKEVAKKTDMRDMATKTDIADVKTYIAELKTEMYRLHNRLILWIVGVGLAEAGIIIIVLKPALV